MNYLCLFGINGSNIMDLNSIDLFGRHKYELLNCKLIREILPQIHRLKNNLKSVNLW